MKKKSTRARKKVSTPLSATTLSAKSTPDSKGAVMLREIKRYKFPKMSIPMSPFARLVQKLLQKNDQPLTIRKKALEHLMRAAELYLVSLFKDASFATLAAARSTTTKSDLQLALRMSTMEVVKCPK